MLSSEGDTVEERIIELNSKLPENVCINMHDFSAFPIYLEKLTNVWTGIIMPDLKPDDRATWLFGFLRYFVDDEPYYILWFFVNDKAVTDEVIIREVKLFLENNEGEDEDESERVV